MLMEACDLDFASSIAFSKAMARSTEGSPNTLAKPNTSRPATKPTSIPRMSSNRTMTSESGSMTRKTEQMAPVMHELMYIHSGKDRCRAFLYADEIDSKKQDNSEDQPGED